MPPGKTGSCPMDTMAGKFDDFLEVSCASAQPIVKAAMITDAKKSLRGFMK